jgi:hypothetical protein
MYPITKPSPLRSSTNQAPANLTRNEKSRLTKWPLHKRYAEVFPLTETNLQVERSAAALEARVERRKEGSSGHPQARDGVRELREETKRAPKAKDKSTWPSLQARERVEHKTVTFTGHPGDIHRPSRCPG